MLIGSPASAPLSGHPGAQLSIAVAHVKKIMGHVQRGDNGGGADGGGGGGIGGGGEGGGGEGGGGEGGGGEGGSGQTSLE